MNKSENTNNRVLIGGLGILLSGFLLLISNSAILDVLRNPISYLYTPMSFLGDRYGQESKEYFTLLNKITEFKIEYEEIKAENLTLEGIREFSELLRKENESLVKQLNLANKQKTYLEADILEGEYGLESDYAILNIGKDNKVEIQDTVVLGNIYIGRISKVGASRSIVLLPSNVASQNKVFIIKPFNLNKKGEETISALENKGIQAVAVGKGGKIIVENILADSGVKPGDIVVTSDERIDGHYVLGKVKSVDRDPAAALVEAEVEQLYDLNALTKVFISIN